MKRTWRGSLMDFARGRTFPLLGIGSSVGLRNAPFSVYVVTPPFLLSSDPILATQYIGALNVLAVGLLYGLARRYYGATAALIAALCLAASPWAVIFSRKLWAQNALMPVRRLDRRQRARRFPARWSARRASRSCCTCRC
jgi:hypothetical protein